LQGTLCHLIDFAFITPAMNPISRMLQRLSGQQPKLHSERKELTPSAASASTLDDYQARIAQEQAQFKDQVDVHALPAIFTYWAVKHLLPKAQAMGFSHPDEFFANHLQLSLASQGPSHFMSMGAGNCDTEIRVAQLLMQRGCTNFKIECLDINPDMLERGRALAAQHGLSEVVVPLQGDFNNWTPKRPYQAIVANQSLHHVVELEHLFEAIYQAMDAEGRFIVSDMIGRNGHQRWPEALEIIQTFWKELPAHYRYNLQLRRQEDVYLDWDCSVSGFEGIRAQDILPLMLDRFGFELFLPFANVIDPFIDRAFGHHFDPDGDWDREFIDRVHARDEQEMQAGRITPTHMFAVARKGRVADCKQLAGLSPERCVRAP
jgi:SAM-dependent methyltransferase